MYILPIILYITYYYILNRLHARYIVNIKKLNNLKPPTLLSEAY